MIPAALHSCRNQGAVARSLRAAIAAAGWRDDRKLVRRANSRNEQASRGKAARWVSAWTDRPGAPEPERLHASSSARPKALPVSSPIENMNASLRGRECWTGWPREQSGHSAGGSSRRLAGRPKGRMASLGQEVRPGKQCSRSPTGERGAPAFLGRATACCVLIENGPGNSPGCTVQSFAARRAEPAAPGRASDCYVSRGSDRHRSVGIPRPDKQHSRTLSGRRNRAIAFVLVARSIPSAGNPVDRSTGQVVRSGQCRRLRSPGCRQPGDPVQ